MIRPSPVYFLLCHQYEELCKVYPSQGVCVQILKNVLKVSLNRSSSHQCLSCLMCLCHLSGLFSQVLQQVAQLCHADSTTGIFIQNLHQKEIAKSTNTLHVW